MTPSRSPKQWLPQQRPRPRHRHVSPALAGQDLPQVSRIDTIGPFLCVLRMGHVEIVGRFARLATIGCIYRGETGFGFSCGHSENPKPVSPRNLG